LEVKINGFDLTFHDLIFVPTFLQVRLNVSLFEVGRGTELDFSFWEDSSTRETVCFSIINSWKILLFVVGNTHRNISTVRVCAQSSTFQVALDGTFGNTRVTTF